MKYCLHCNKHFNSLSGLTKHIKSKHDQTYVGYKKTFNIYTHSKNKINEANIVYHFLKRIEQDKSIKYTNLKQEDYKLLCQIEKSSFKNISNLCDRLGFTKERKDSLGVKTNGKLMSNDEILYKLIHLKSNNKLTTSSIRCEFEDSRLQSAIYKKFGNVENCLSFFNLERDGFRWSKDDIISKIHKYNEDGIDLSYMNMIIHDSKLVSSIKNHFDMSWSDLIDSLDVKHTRGRRKLSKEIIIEILNGFIKNDISISPMSIKFHDDSLPTSIYQYFGSYENLYLSMNLNPEDYLSYSNLQGIGCKFEKLVKKVFDYLKIERKYNKTVQNLRPDFQLDNNIWVDAKLSSWTAFHDGTFDKYLPHCDKLIIVYLRGQEIINVPEKVQLLNIAELFPKLKEIKQTKIISQINQIFNEISELNKCS